MDSYLRQFNGDVRTKEALIAFVADFIDQSALKTIYAKGDVSGYADARTLLNGAFEALAEQYATPTPTKEPTSNSK